MLQIPGYRILHVLGEGGMATVYLAVQESFDRQVALKVMAPELAHTDSDYGERFLREARIVAKLIDPHIVTVYDVGVHQGLHYLAMEFIPGVDLRQYRHRMSLTQCLLTVGQIAQALGHAHHQGYIHRDIKPENILIHRHNGRAVLTDFGIAKPTGSDDDANPVGGAMGTPSFMSPEQALGQPLDHRSDLYSLGIVSFYLLSGKVPFTGDSPVTISMKHALDAIPRLPGELSRYQALVDKALAKHPDQRFQSGHEFAQAVDEARMGVSQADEVFWKSLLQAEVSLPETTQTVGLFAANGDGQKPDEASALSAKTSGFAGGLLTVSNGSGALSSLAIAVARQTRRLALMVARIATMSWRGLALLTKWLGRISGLVWRWLWLKPKQRLLPSSVLVFVTVFAAWLLLRADWNVASAKKAYQAGELDKAEYNTVIKALKAEHQARLDELKEALQHEKLSREDYLNAVRKAKQEYTGEVDCGSWFGC